MPLQREKRLILRASPFTLMELLIVFMLISIGAALTGIKINDLYKEQRFYSESQQLLGQLMLAQELMLIMDTDVLLVISNDKKEHHLSSQLKLAKPLEEASRKIIERVLTFDSIKTIKYEGVKKVKTSLPLELIFTLGNMPDGYLTFFDASESSINEETRRFIVKLPGYPAPLKQVAEKEEVRGRRERKVDEALYPIEVYEKLYKDPHENQKTP